MMLSSASTVSDSDGHLHDHTAESGEHDLVESRLIPGSVDDSPDPRIASPSPRLRRRR